MRETIIEAKCLTEGCDDICIKSLRLVCDNGGCYCKKHTQENKRQKIKQTCIKKYGSDCPFQNEEVKEKIKNTFIEKYGCENPKQSKIVMEKSKNTCIEKYGVHCPLKSKEIRNKSKKYLYRKIWRRTSFSK